MHKMSISIQRGFDVRISHNGLPSLDVSVRLNESDEDVSKLVEAEYKQKRRECQIKCRTKAVNQSVLVRQEVQGMARKSRKQVAAEIKHYPLYVPETAGYVRLSVKNGMDNSIENLKACHSYVGR